MKYQEVGIIWATLEADPIYFFNFSTSKTNVWIVWEDRGLRGLSYLGPSYLEGTEVTTTNQRFYDDFWILFLDMYLSILNLRI